MKTTSAPHPVSRPASEEQIREKAHELYVRSGWVAGCDLDNWFKAEAFLTSDPLGAPRPSVATHSHLLPVYGPSSPSHWP